MSLIILCARWSRVRLLVAAQAIAACATTLHAGTPPPDMALAPRDIGRLAVVEQRPAAAQGADVSAFELIIVPVARQATTVFDRDWNGDWVRCMPPGRASGSAAVTPQMIELPPEAAGHPAVQAFLTDAARRAGDIDRPPDSMAIGKRAVHTGVASRAAGSHKHMPEAFQALMRSARSEVLVTNACTIPDDVFVADLRGLTGRAMQAARTDFDVTDDAGKERRREAYRRAEQFFRIEASISME